MSLPTIDSTNPIIVPTKAHAEIQANLDRFHGSEELYYLALGSRKIHYTEGVKYLRSVCECTWLIIAIASYQTPSFMRQYDRQFWKLEVVDDGTANLICDDGDENILVTQKIAFTDFPLPIVKIWLDCNAIPDGYLMFLPSEY